MELLDRYLHAVKKSLPKAQQDDILAEISDAIQSQVEEKETELGRPLTRDEESDILKQYGHPRLVASRYGDYRSLIGPEMLPFYWHTLKIALPVALILAFFGAGMYPGGPLPSFGVMWGALLSTFFIVVGAVTVVFAALEYGQRSLGRRVSIDGWDPRKLPPSDLKVVPYADSIFELIINGAILLWLLNMPWVRHAFSYTAVGPAANTSVFWPFELSPVWQQVVPPIAALIGLNLLINCANLIRPDWTRLRAGAHLATNGALVLVAGFILLTHPLVAVAAGAHHSAKLVDAAGGLDMLAHGIVAVGGLSCVVMMFFDLRRLRGQRKMFTVHSPANGLA